ncbi:hypothetical protein ACMFMG_006149 [Clarireedia jacksonii]
MGKFTYGAEQIDYTYHHNAIPSEGPQYNRFIEYAYEVEKDEARSALVKEIENTNFLNYFNMDGTKVPGITHTLFLGIDFPTTLPAELYYPNVMLAAWAIHSAGWPRCRVHGNRQTRGAYEHYSPPLATSIKKELTFRKTVKLVKKRMDEASKLQHLVRLGDKLDKLMASVPVLVVHHPDDYEEATTKNLGLVRSRAEPVQRSVDAMFMNFCMRPGNAGVDLLLTIDESFSPEDKAALYLGYLEQVFKRVFTSGGLD